MPKISVSPTLMMAYMLPSMMPLRMSWTSTSIARPPDRETLFFVADRSAAGAPRPFAAALLRADAGLHLGDRGIGREDRDELAALPLHQEGRGTLVLARLVELGA